MEKSRRVARVEKELREAIASYFVTHLRSELPGIITVSHVFAGADLRSAKVYLSVLAPEGTSEDEFLEVIEEHTGMIQHFVNGRIKMKFCPKLRFYLDDGMAQVAKVGQNLKEIQQQAQDDGTDDVDT